MSTGKKILYGGLAGFIGAIAFGLMMQQMMPAVLPKIAKLYGATGAGTGFVIHLVHGALIGGVYGIISGASVTKGASSFYGLVYGFGWWILGPVLVMPTWLGAGPRLSSEGIQAALSSLPGHLVYGIILGLLFAYFTGTNQHSQQTNQRQQTSDANAMNTNTQ